MRRVMAVLLTGSVAAVSPGFAQEACVSNPPNCVLTAPSAPPNWDCRQPPSPKSPESAPQQPQGAYIRGPESGEFEGGSNSLGFRGFGFTLPQISMQSPEIRLPSLTRYRKNPVFHSQSAQVPFVRGPVSEFSQVQKEESAPENPKTPEAAPNRRPESFETAPCVPPTPISTSSAVERRLRNELAQKDAEFQKLQQKLGRLEEIVIQLSDAHSAPKETTSHSPLPQKIVGAAYEEVDEEPVEPITHEPAKKPTTKRPWPWGMKLLKRGQ